jgi:serpin B
MAHGEHDGTHLIELPYQGGQLSCVIIVPEAGELAALEAGLTPEWFEQAMSGVSATDVLLYLPKFRIESSFAGDAMQALGMVDAFGGGFSAWTAPSLYIDAIVHKAFVSVDETGTAAAPPPSSWSRCGRSTDQPGACRCPFLFVVRDIPPTRFCLWDVDPRVSG